MKYDLIIIGGGAGGISVALAVKQLYPEKRILVIRRTKKQPIPCGVPYIVKRIGSVDGNIIPDSIFEGMGIDLVIDEAISIDRENRRIKTRGGKEFEYEKLVIATGARPARINIPGIDLKNVVLIQKEYEPLLEVYETLKNAKKIVIIGAGFVGMEIADDLCGDRKVHIVEILDEALPLAFDKEFGRMARMELERRGVRFYLGVSVREIVGNGRVERVILDNGEEIDADAVVVSVGTVPNSDIAKNAGLNIDKYGHIVVDAYMRTSDPNIYAVGDVAQKKNFFTGTPMKAYFSTLAIIEGRIAALHMFGGVSLGATDGALPAYSTVIGGKTFAAAGLTEEMARKMGLDIIPIKVETVNRHPAGLPNAEKILFKATFTRDDLRIIGVQIAGPKSIGEMINFAAVTIQLRLSAYDIIRLQFATQPLLTASPLSYPLHLAALKAIATQRK